MGATIEEAAARSGCSSEETPMPGGTTSPGSAHSYLSVQRLPEPHHARVRLHSEETRRLLPRHAKHQGVIVHVSC